jgi:hypothetical protein
MSDYIEELNKKTELWLKTSSDSKKFHKEKAKYFRLMGKVNEAIYKTRCDVLNTIDKEIADPDLAFILKEEAIDQFATLRDLSRREMRSNRPKRVEFNSV